MSALLIKGGRVIDPGQGIDRIADVLVERDVLKRIDAQIPARDGTEVIDARERFDRLLESRRREELFVLDGHLSDTGYAEIADLVAERLREGK